METTKAQKRKNGYIETVGRRKTSTARVRLQAASKGTFEVNGKSADDYFPTAKLASIVRDPLGSIDGKQTFIITVVVKGGGSNSQAEAIRHGVSRALVELDEESRSKLKKAGYLKRDPRAKERRKFGLKKARKSPQWSKR